MVFYLPKGSCFSGAWHMENFGICPEHCGAYVMENWILSTSSKSVDFIFVLVEVNLVDLNYKLPVAEAQISVQFFYPQLGYSPSALSMRGYRSARDSGRVCM